MPYSNVFVRITSIAHKVADMNHEVPYTTITAEDPGADLPERMRADPDAYFREARDRARVWIVGHLEDVFGLPGRDFSVAHERPGTHQD
jgi:hypothetical protein